jgi:hypothetical protein
LKAERIFADKSFHKYEKELEKGAEIAAQEKVNQFKSRKEELETRRLHVLTSNKINAVADREHCRTPPMMRDMVLREEVINRNTLEK